MQDFAQKLRRFVIKNNLLLKHAATLREKFWGFHARMSQHDEAATHRFAGLLLRVVDGRSPGAAQRAISVQ